MRRWRAVAAGLVIAAPTLGSASAAAPGGTVGQTASTPVLAVPCGGSAMVVQDADAGAPTYLTTTGVVTSWSVMAGSAAQSPIKLKIVRTTAPSTYLVTGSSQVRSSVPGTLNTFADRIPVVTGDRLAVYVTTPGGSASCAFNSANAGDVISFTSSFAQADTGVGGSFTTTSFVTSRRLDVAATIEPDADGDGYGDLTQDGCPGRATQTTECVPPDTTLTAPRTVRTSAKRVRVKALFLATEPATFTCSVDGGRAKPCTSPFKVKLKIGKHHVSVTATDAAGNVDPTPALATVKVKRKH
jgi:hypothetical protein